MTFGTRGLKVLGVAVSLSTMSKELEIRSCYPSPRRKTLPWQLTVWHTLYTYHTIFADVGDDRAVAATLDCIYIQRYGICLFGTELR